MRVRDLSGVFVGDVCMKYVCVRGEGGEEGVGLCFPVVYISYSKTYAWEMLNTKQQS